MKCTTCEGNRIIFIGNSAMSVVCQQCFGTGERQICDVCQKNWGDGTVGSMNDSNVFIVCCKECYPIVMGHDFPNY